MSNVDSKVLDWALGGKTGSSSLTMATHLTGRKLVDKWHSHPSDGGDLGRCIGLLNAAPELRPLLPKMAEVSPYWAALVVRWDDLEQSHANPGADTYKLMRSVLDPVEKQDRSVVRLGEGVTMRFGR